MQKFIFGAVVIFVISGFIFAITYSPSDEYKKPEKKEITQTYDSSNELNTKVEEKSPTSVTTETIETTEVSFNDKVSAQLITKIDQINVDKIEKNDDYDSYIFSYKNFLIIVYTNSETIDLTLFNGKNNNVELCNETLYNLLVEKAQKKEESLQNNLEDQILSAI